MPFGVPSPLSNYPCYRRQDDLDDARRANEDTGPPEYEVADEVPDPEPPVPVLRHFPDWARCATDEEYRERVTLERCRQLFGEGWTPRPRRQRKKKQSDSSRPTMSELWERVQKRLPRS